MPICRVSLLDLEQLIKDGYSYRNESSLSVIRSTKDDAFAFNISENIPIHNKFIVDGVEQSSTEGLQELFLKGGILEIVWKSEGCNPSLACL
jgi:hypothetical protein